MVTMLLGGMWHGANWTFVFWGGIHGAALCLDKLLPRKERPGAVGKAAGTLLTFAFVSFCWIFFRAETFGDAWAVIRGMVTLQDGIRQPFSWSFFSIALLCLCTWAAVRRARRQRQDGPVRGYCPVLDLDTVGGLTVFFVFCGLILALAYTGENPFVYFQF